MDTGASPAFEAIDLQRIVIIGNAGSGKTHIAREVSRRLSLPVTHLDDLHWESGNYGRPRDKAAAAELTRKAAGADHWIIEGVYGWLAAIALVRATALIWLDIPDAECLHNLRVRGIQGGGSPSDFDGLLRWAADYRVRTNANSYAAHEKLYAEFPRRKARLTNRGEIDRSVTLLSTL